MAATARQRRLLGQLAYLAASLALLVAAILPLSPGAVGWAGPDWLTAMTFAWVLRRPEQVPVLSVAMVMLAADALLLRPLGLGAAIAVAATEAARRREQRWSESGFPAEWMRVAVLMTLMMLTARVLHVLFVIPVTLAPLPVFGQDTLRVIATVGAYPVVAAVMRAIGPRRAAPAEMDLV